MDEENRTLTTEFSDAAVEVITIGGPMEIPEYAINIMAEFFLKRMQEEYLREHETTN